MPFILHKLSFAAGELSPWLDGRTDLDKYTAGCRELVNFIPLPQGAIQKRPGMEYLGNMVTGATSGRLVEFQTSTEDAAMLVIGGGKVAVWVDGAPALDGGLPIELAMPWSDADIELLRWKQINDVMWLVHPLYAPRKLVRYAADDWELTIADVARKPPLLAENFDDDWTVTTDFTVGGSPAAWSAAVGLYAAGVRVTHSGKTWVCQKAHAPTAPKAPGLGTATYVYSVVLNGRTADTITKPLWVEGFADLSAVEEQIIALTSNRNTWVAGHVGSVWEISKKRVGTDYEVFIKATNANNGLYSPTIVIQGGWSFITFGTWKGTFTIEKSEDRGATWKEVRAFESEGERNLETEGAEDLRCLMRVKWTHLSAGSSDPRGILSSIDPQIRGLVKITAFTNARAVTAEVLTPVEKTTTYLFKEGAWSAVQGYPRTVELHQARIVMGGTTLKPHTIFGSAIDDYDNFYPGTDADQGYRHTVAIGEKDPILWLVSERFLLIGTGAGEWVMHGEDEEKAITPEFGVAKRHSSYGSHNGGVPACFADSVSLFVQRGGTRVREFSYRFEADRYEAANLNLLADHLFTSPVDDIAVQRMPWQVVWFVSAGKLYGLTFERAQNVAAWHRHETAGDVLSVGCLRGAGDEDEVYFLVDRGQGDIFVERFRAGHMTALPDDGWWQDCAVEVADTFNLSGTPLAGLEVTAWMNGEIFGPATASGTTWPFLSGYLVNLAVSFIAQGSRGGKVWFAVSDTAEVNYSALYFIQWDEAAAQWVVFVDGELWYYSAEDVALPGDVVEWELAPAALAPLNLVPITLSPLYQRAMRITGVTGTPLDVTFAGFANGRPKYANPGGTIVLQSTGTEWQLDLTPNFWNSGFTAGYSPHIAPSWSGSPGTPVIVPLGDVNDTAIFGLPYTANVRPMTPDIPLANGSSRSRELRIHRVVTSLRESRGGKLGETVDGPLDPMNAGSIAARYTGELENEFDGGHGIGGNVVVVSDEPFPFAIRSLALKMNAYGDE